MGGIVRAGTGEKSHVVHVTRRGLCGKQKYRTNCDYLCPVDPQSHYTLPGFLVFQVTPYRVPTHESLFLLPPDLTPCSASPFFRVLTPGGVNGKDSAGSMKLTDPCFSDSPISVHGQFMSLLSYNQFSRLDSTGSLFRSLLR